MPKYVTDKQMTGDSGEAFASYVVTTRVRAIFRATSRRDTGVDGELELTTPCDETKMIASGTFLKVQIKAKTNTPFAGNELSVQLDAADKDYFTNEMNAPGVLLYADLHSNPHELYWAEIIPTRIQGDGVVHVQKQNRVSADTRCDFARICRIQTRQKMQSALKAMAVDYFERMKELVAAANTEDGLGHVLSDLNEDVDGIQRVFELALVGGMKTQEIAGYENIFDDAVEFQKLRKSKVDEIDKLLADKGLPSYSDLVKY